MRKKDRHQSSVKKKSAQGYIEVQYVDESGVWCCLIMCVDINFSKQEVLTTLALKLTKTKLTHPQDSKLNLSA